MNAAEPGPSGAFAAGEGWGNARSALRMGTLFALVGAFLYGANIPAARIASGAGLPGADLIFYRALFLVPLVALLAGLTRQSLAVPRGERGTIARLAVTAGLTATFYLSAVDHLPVPFAVTIFYTFPLIVMLLTTLAEGRRLRPRQIGVFAIAFLGLVLAVGPSAEGLALRGVAFALFAALACAVMFITAGRVNGPPVRSLFWIQVAAALIAFTVAVLNGGPAPMAVFANAPIAIGIAMGAFAIAFFFQLLAAQRISPSRTALLFLLEPVTSIVIAGALLGETLGAIQIAGVALILVALAAEILLDAPAALAVSAPDERA